jgi:hypothetical protein
MDTLHNTLEEASISIYGQTLIELFQQDSWKVMTMKRISSIAMQQYTESQIKDKDNKIKELEALLNECKGYMKILSE